VRLIIKKFKEEQRKTRGIKNKKDSKQIILRVNKLIFAVAWDNLLNWMSNTVFYGQRPSVLWTRKHDIDLLRGTYQYGYANYHLIKNDPEYTLNELDKGN